MGCLVWANKVETICDVPSELFMWIGQRLEEAWSLGLQSRDKIMCDVYQAKSGSDKEPCRRNSVDQTQEFRMPRDRLVHIGVMSLGKGFRVFLFCFCPRDQRPHALGGGEFGGSMSRD